MLYRTGSASHRGAAGPHEEVAVPENLGQPDDVTGADDLTRIEAIGPTGLHDRFLANPTYLARVARRIDAYGLQFASEPRDDILLPEFIGNTRLRWGAPLVESE